MFEALYSKINFNSLTNLSHAEAAVEVLRVLQGQNSGNGFLVQEFNLRVRLITLLGSGPGLLSPDYVFSRVKSELIELNIPEILPMAIDSEDIVNLKKFREIKNILGPIELLKKAGYSDEFFVHWLKIRSSLP